MAGGACRHPQAGRGGRIAGGRVAEARGTVRRVAGLAGGRRLDAAVRRCVARRVRGAVAGRGDLRPAIAAAVQTRDDADGAR